MALRHESSPLNLPAASGRLLHGEGCHKGGSHGGHRGYDEQASSRGPSHASVASKEAKYERGASAFDHVTDQASESLARLPDPLKSC
jgi:hypothetical protein